MTTQTFSSDSSSDISYVHLMALLGERSCAIWQDDTGCWNAKLTMRARRDQCFAWATQFEHSRPTLAADLHAAALHFARTIATETL